MKCRPLVAEGLSGDSTHTLVTANQGQKVFDCFGCDFAEQSQFDRPGVLSSIGHDFEKDTVGDFGCFSENTRCICRYRIRKMRGNQ